MTANVTRLASANTYDKALGQLTTRQSQLARLQEQLSASKKILRPSDDPTGAAQAERAMTRMARVATDQRALEVQRNSVTTAESALGDALSAMQDFRALVVQAGNTALTPADRASIAQRMASLRDQLLGFANATDSNGQPLFAGLGSTASPFVDHGGSVSFDGISGQPGATDLSVPQVLDGAATFMDVPTGNGVFVVTQGAGTTAVWSGPGEVDDPAALTGHGYRIQFSSTPTGATYDVVDTTTGITLQATQPFTPGQSIAFDGLTLKVNGSPASGDSLDIAPSTRSSVFAVMDQAIAGVRSGSGGALSHQVALGLAQVDAAMSRISASRGRAGDLLNQVDNIASRQSARSVQLEADRSRAEDLDVVQALSAFQTQQTAYTAALGSYAQIQKLSLFNFLG